MIADDLIVQGNACIGNACEDGEVFYVDTLRLKGDNIGIHFMDNSGPGFASNDWGFTINGSGLTGQNFFQLVDRGENGLMHTGVFRIDAGSGGAIMLGHGATSSGM